MAHTIYEFENYREYLQQALPTQGPERGSRNRLAERLGCQKGFVSLVLSGGAHFSLEHAPKISRFLEHDPTEEDYFLLLVHLGRAGSEELARYYQGKMRAILAARREIKDRVQAGITLTEADQIRYYSSWHASAIHMCLYLPGLETKAAIGELLGLPQSLVARTLDFLTKAGLAKQQGDRYSAGPARIHLPSDSPLISKHHTNWRVRALQSLDEPQERDLHYSLVMSVSEEAAEAIRGRLLAAIQELEPILKAAKDETVYSLGIDLFSLTGGR